ncbi:hypothetical protein DE146DRAFT_667957 [Phaeosphaeria sp. MPI-PUGE-AT-0046c]|nr:hypothetical protein DE146DRAFT_667957 [Phaeosphaeria sp. MPI-PUGE-AT-0046c]
MAHSNTPIILDKKLLGDGLHSLLTSFAKDLSSELSVPMFPEAEIQASAASLSTYLGHFVRLSLRRSTKPLLPSNLDYRILRSRNAAEETQDGDGNYVKGEKKWYRLVLFETTKNASDMDVQILAEGEMTLIKGEVLEGFNEGVEKKVDQWKVREKERDKVLRREATARRSERRKMKKEVGAKEKGGGKKGRGKVKMGKDTGDEKLELDMADEMMSVSEDEMPPSQFTSSQHKGKRKERTSAFEDLNGSDDEWTMDMEDDFDPMTYKAKKREKKGEVSKSVSENRRKSKDMRITVKKVGRPKPPPEFEGDAYGYDSESGGYEGIRVKKKNHKGKVRFQDDEEEEVDA